MGRKPLNRWQPLAIFFGGSFILHLLWENLQAPLFAGYTSFWQHFIICLPATGGDILVMAFMYGTLALFHRDFFWVANPAAYTYQRTWILPLLVGIAFAIPFEWWAVNVAERWEYAGMPLLPWLRIGVTPVLQMIAVPILTILLTRASVAGRVWDSR
ncbi:MAG TPA: hypothetical protein VI913_04040 [Candidatus Peribacteraceae bacterium]|nr:hypothetical protein [Candidatus Peribacteraceae bacterium]